MITLTIEQFNELGTAACRAGLTRCCGAHAWVEGMLQARPFASLNQLYETAGNLWWSLHEDDWREAFTHHPKIGDIDNLRQKFAQTAALSEAEQSGVQQASEETLQALAKGNTAYEEKFGYIFIVCATGKSAAEMLAILQTRLSNDPDVELRLAAEEQRKITFIRLGNWLSEVKVARHIAIVALHGADGRWALQLRDDLPDIAWPNRWGMFGGGIEEDEDPMTAVAREVKEELAVELPVDRFQYGRSYFEPQNGRLKILHLFYCPITNELADYVLHEGQRLSWLTTDQITAGIVDGHELAPHHREMLLWCIVRVADTAHDEI